MKLLLLILSILFSLATIPSNAQTQTDSLYMVTYTIGTSWDSTKKPTEQKYFKEHGQNLAALRKSGTIKFGARSGDKGILFISASTLEKAKEIVNADIAVVNQLFNVDVQKLKPFYYGCIEDSK